MRRYNTSIARWARTESLDIEPPRPLLPRSLRGPALSEHDGGESISEFIYFTLCAGQPIVARIFYIATLLSKM